MEGGVARSPHMVRPLGRSEAYEPHRCPDNKAKREEKGSIGSDAYLHTGRGGGREDKSGTETGEGRGGRKNKGGMGRKERSGGEGGPGEGGKERAGRARNGDGGRGWRELRLLLLPLLLWEGGGKEARAAINPPSPEVSASRRQPPGGAPRKAIYEHGVTMNIRQKACFRWSYESQT